MLTAIELFAGIGGFNVACQELDIQTVWANDICPKACKVYKHCFGKESVSQGDIKELKAQIPTHDVLLAGFPCQPFSSAGKKQGIRDVRGTLFQEIVSIIKNHQPQYFVLENVKRLLNMENGVHFATILDALCSLNYQVEWRLLNAMDFGLPQNRARVFIIGTKKVAKETSYLLQSTEVNEIPAILKSKLTFNQWRCIKENKRKFPTWGMAYQGKFIAYSPVNFEQIMSKVYLKDILQADQEVSNNFDYTESTRQRLKNSTKVNRFVNGVEIAYNQGGGARMGYTVFGVNGIAPTLTASSSRHYERYHINEKFRRLTNIEYARIQGFDDNHCTNVSVYDQYALYGNAVPPPMVKWVLKQLINEKTVSLRSGALQTILF